MTTGWADGARRTGARDDPRGRTDQRFTDALCGPDGTGDPSVLMPVLQVYPDALSAPMPDTMVALPPLDPAAAVAAGLPTPPLTPAQARVAAQRATERAAAAQRMAQPVRSGQVPSAQRRPSSPTPPGAPSAWGNREPRSAVAPHLQGPRQPGTNQAPAGSAARPQGNAALHTGLSGPTLRTTLSELGNLARSGFPRNTVHGITAGGAPAASRHQPAAHGPAPSLPRNVRSGRNRGSSIWAVIVFLIVIAFASGIAQQLIGALGELFNR